jgi:hypothetical protein
MAPPYGVFKVNWNTAIDKSKKMTGVRVIVQAQQGNIMTALRDIGKLL